MKDKHADWLRREHNLPEKKLPRSYWVIVAAVLLVLACIIALEFYHLEMRYRLTIECTEDGRAALENMPPDQLGPHLAALMGASRTQAHGAATILAAHGIEYVEAIVVCSGK